MADDVTPSVRKIPAPAQNLESKPFWDAAKEGRFLLKHCTACDKAHWYPRSICPFCASGETVWQESPGAGVIYTYSIMHRNTPVPYAIGYVTLDEGVSVLTNFVDCDLASLAIGQRVKLKWTETENGPPVFTFTPA
ncbi:MAG TPA: OB-fold domain-containing protein [Caulobacteraceae bacterium]|nr:OB-fold domain-containing protein [Caulobacteraceae bacterium]